MATASVTIAPDNIKTRVKAHLAVIGRRLNVKEGDKNYQRIVLTENELSLIDDYFTAAAAFLAAQFPDVLVSYDSAKGEQGFEDASRRNAAAFSALDDVYSSYILSYCIGEYLATINVDMAKKYQQDAVQFLQAIRNIIYSKTEPSSSSTSSYLSQPSITQL